MGGGAYLSSGGVLVAIEEAFQVIKLVDVINVAAVRDLARRQCVKDGVKGVGLQESK